MTQLRRFTPAGLDAFAAYIAKLRTEPKLPPPSILLQHDEYSAVLDEQIEIAHEVFADQYLFGRHLNQILSLLDPRDIAYDGYAWSWLALFFFDTICPSVNGHRDALEEAAYVMRPKTNYQRFYRHLVRTPWVALRMHGENSKILLKTQSSSAKRSDIFEQLVSRQELFGNATIIGVAYAMYFDTTTDLPKRGSGGKQAGSARRLASIVQQLDLTFDLNDCTPAQLLTMLPTEFARWKRSLTVMDPSGPIDLPPTSQETQTR